uniref:5-hydroxyisourate hydrolase n=1 Tax=Angiostrongylus cantonensis TaxID=6313 RepID=A0A0K0DKV0_ANGCA
MVISTFLQPPTASVSTHILDISLGRPAEGVTILAYVEEGGQWKLIGNRSTTADGRVPWVSPNVALTRANYKLQFMIGNYYEKLSIQTFYPYVEVVFTITDATQHYHVPLTLSPYGYSTYRGS